MLDPLTEFLDGAAIEFIDPGMANVMVRIGGATLPGKMPTTILVEDIETGGFVQDHSASVSVRAALLPASTEIGQLIEINGESWRIESISAGTADTILHLAHPDSRNGQ